MTLVTIARGVKRHTENAIVQPAPLSRDHELVYASNKVQHPGRQSMAFYAFYVIAITILVLHFTGWLKRNNLEWIVLVLAVATFPAVIFLR
jgi:hypothetical protein